MLTWFSFFLSFFIWFLLFYLFLSYIYFLSSAVWDCKLTNPKLDDRPQLWPILPPVLA